DGLEEFQRAAGMKALARMVTLRWLRQISLPLYLGSMAAMALALTWCCWVIIASSQAPAWAIGLATALCLVSAIQVALLLVNWVAAILVAPVPLPRVDFSEGIPEEHQRLVVIPTMLTSKAAVEHLLEALEVRYLANQDPNLGFGLLTDLCDSTQEQC